MSVRNQERTPIRVRAEMDFRDIKGALVGSADETISIDGSSVADIAGVAILKATDANGASATPSTVVIVQ